MRGSPLLRASLVFLALLALSPFLWRMTHESARAVPTTPVSQKVDAVDLPLELAFTAAPKRVVITHLQKEVWTKDNPESEENLTLTLPWPAEGGELKFAVEWPEEAKLSAMRVTLADPERGEIERTLWGRGSKTGVLGFP
jgi:hypothetical protein